MADRVTELFEEYVASFERGERPDLRAYLARAGKDEEELARLVDAWLQIAPPPEPDEEAVALTQAWIAGEPPLVALRVRRGITREQVVDLLITNFSLERKKRMKVERYYHQVETGQLAPSSRIREALEAILGRAALDWKPRPLAAEPAYFRAPAAMAVAPDMKPAEPERWDEIDELFRGA